MINGSKAFITNSGTDITTLVTITARTAPDEISAIIVPSGTPGFIVEPAYRKVGFRDVGVMRAYEKGADGTFHDSLLMDMLAEDLR